MFNFSSIRKSGLLGKLLRLPLRLLPGNTVMRIRQGPLRSRKWIVGSFVHGCWLGSYEMEKQLLVASMVKPGRVFFDVGAHVGYYSLLASTLVGEAGRVVAFEPNPRNQDFFERHVKLNDLRNVTLFKAAVSDRTGEAAFDFGKHSAYGRLHPSGTQKVPTVALDELVAAGQVPTPDYLKIDVEGAEFAVLQGARSILSSGPRVLFLATHGPDVHRQCLEFLRGLGYACKPVNPADNLETCDDILAQNPPA